MRAELVWLYKNRLWYKRLSHSLISCHVLKHLIECILNNKKCYHITGESKWETSTWFAYNTLFFWSEALRSFFFLQILFFLILMRWSSVSKLMCVLNRPLIYQKLLDTENMKSFLFKSYPTNSSSSYSYNILLYWKWFGVRYSTKTFKIISTDWSIFLTVIISSIFRYSPLISYLSQN